MLICCLNAQTQSQLRAQLSQSLDADLFELRLDLVAPSLWLTCRPLLRRKPLLLTWRCQNRQQALHRRAAYLFWIRQIKPHLVDCQWPEDMSLLQPLSTIGYAQRQVIVSYHAAQTISQRQLMQIDKEMKAVAPLAFQRKIAMPANSLDALILLQHQRMQQKATYLAMAQESSWSRLLAPYYGAQLCYAQCSVGPSSAPGQIRLPQMIHLYGLKRKRAPRIFALLGDPVTHSIGHLVHNKLYNVLGEESLYVKVPLPSSHLKAFMDQLAAHSPFAGFSITMPHKESITALSDHLSPTVAACGSANTLVRKGSHWCAHQTDGLAAIEAIEAKIGIQGAQILLFGAGGTARAIVYEAKQRGAKAVWLTSRNDQRAQRAASRLCDYLPWSHRFEFLGKQCDIVINATPVGMTPNSHETILPPHLLRREWIVLDVVSHPQPTLLIEQAKMAGCQTIDGGELYLRQAAAQIALWHPHHCRHELLSLLHAIVKEHNI